jgi:hypothetical protein
MYSFGFAQMWSTKARIWVLVVYMRNDPRKQGEGVRKQDGREENIKLVVMGLNPAQDPKRLRRCYSSMPSLDC